MSSLAYTLLLLGVIASVSCEQKIGALTNKAHGVAGDVYIKDEKTLVLKDFTYDGAGPDAFFWIGTKGKPNSVGTILPYPFEGKFYTYEDQDAPILNRRFNGEEITLTLPAELKTSDLKWFSVWCRQFAVNFGDVFFPEKEEAVHEADPDYHEETHVPDELPPPLIEPNNNAHDPNRFDENWKEDPDTYSEAEAESSATPLTASAALLLLTALLN